MVLKNWPVVQIAANQGEYVSICLVIVRGLVVSGLSEDDFRCGEVGRDDFCNVTRLWGLNLSDSLVYTGLVGCH